MSEIQLEALFNQFLPSQPVESIVPFGHGHINDTYLVKTVPESAPNYILQRKNHQIFKDVPGMLNNIILTTAHLRMKLGGLNNQELQRRVMTYLPAVDGKLYVQDDSGNFWTLFLFIADSYSVEQIENVGQAELAARAFGHFQKLLADLSGEKLIETIPNFHNGISRLNDFKKAIQADLAERVKSYPELIEKILNRAEEMTALQRGLNEGSIPLRITHNDTKINNILFDEKLSPLCIIDLDTVMPGSALYDFGDAIRTLGNTAPEDEPNLEKIQFNRTIFEAFTRGYLSEAREFLTDTEISSLAYSCRYMAWEQAMRFFTDFLNGDTYYKTSYPGHNLTRTLAQLRYLEVLEENRQDMEQIVLEN